MYDKMIYTMACACENKTTNSVQAAKVKQVVKSKSITPTASTRSNGGHKAAKRVIYRRSV